MMHVRTATVMTGLTALILAGCGAGDPRPGPEVAGGNAGVDERVDADVSVLDVELEYPPDGAYEAGGTARLCVAISNTGEEPDVLTAVSGPDFGGAVDDTPADGLAVAVPGDDTVYVGAEGEPSLALVDLERGLRSSESIPVTFRFEDAGTDTAQAVVTAEGQGPAPTYDFPAPDQDPSSDS